MKIRIVGNGRGKKIHEMQIFEWVNDRSIFCCLISVELWLIVLLLCNYPEFAQGLDVRAAASAYFPSSPRGPACNLGLWRLANPPAKAYWLCHLHLRLPAPWLLMRWNRYRWHKALLLLSNGTWCIGFSQVRRDPLKKALMLHHQL